MCDKDNLLNFFLENVGRYFDYDDLTQLVPDVDALVLELIKDGWPIQMGHFMSYSLQPNPNLYPVRRLSLQEHLQNRVSGPVSFPSGSEAQQRLTLHTGARHALFSQEIHNDWVNPKERYVVLSCRTCDEDLLVYDLTDHSTDTPPY